MRWLNNCMWKTLAMKQTINLAIQKLPFELCKVLVTFKSIKAIWPIATPKSVHLAPATFQLPSKALKCLCLLWLPKASVWPLQGSSYFQSIKAPLPIVTPKSFRLSSAMFWLPSKALKCRYLLWLPKAFVWPLQGSSYLPKHQSAFAYCDSEKLLFGLCKVLVAYQSIKAPLSIVTPKFTTAWKLNIFYL